MLNLDLPDFMDHPSLSQGSSKDKKAAKQINSSQTRSLSPVFTDCVLETTAETAHTHTHSFKKQTAQQKDKQLHPFVSAQTSFIDPTDLPHDHDIHETIRLNELSNASCRIDELKILNKKARNRDAEAYTAIFKWVQIYQRSDGKHFSIDHATIQESMRLLIRHGSPRKVNRLVKWMCTKEAFSEVIFDAYIAVLDQKERRKNKNIAHPIRQTLEAAFPNWCKGHQVFEPQTTQLVEEEKKSLLLEVNTLPKTPKRLSFTKQQALMAYQEFLKTGEPCAIVKKMGILKDLHTVQEKPHALTRATSVEELMVLMTAKNLSVAAEPLNLQQSECQKIMHDVIVYCNVTLSQELIEWAAQHETCDKSTILAFIKGFQTKDKEQLLTHFEQLAQVVDLYNRHNYQSDDKEVAPLLWARQKLAKAQLESSLSRSNK